MIPEERYNFAKTKYPEIFDGYCISLRYVGDRLILAKQLKNDINSLKILGLENFESDIRYIFGTSPEYLRKERKEKLKKLSNDNTE